MDPIFTNIKLLHYPILLIYLLILPGNIDTLFSQEEKGEPQEWRRDWFYGQRMYPYDSIPSRAYINSINQKNASIKNSGNDNYLQGEWTCIGPKPFLGSCLVSPSPQAASGRVAALMYDPRDANGYKTIWIAAATGGVWKTTNSGENWIERNVISTNPLEILPTLNSGALAIDDERNIIYYGTGVNIFFDERYMGMGIFRSTNEGQTWENISNGLMLPTQIFKIAIDPRPGKKDHIFIADRKGLFETINGGQSWQRVTQVLPPNPEVKGAYCTDVCFSPNGDKVYAIGPSKNFWPESYFNGIGFWISNDYGVTFNEVQASTNFPVTMRLGRTHLAVSRHTNLAFDGLLYVMTYNGDNTNILIYRTTDYGSHFSDISGNNIWTLGGNAGYNQTIRCSDYDPNICFIGYQELYRTTNGASLNPWDVKWTKTAGSLTDVHVDFHTIDISPANPYNEVTVGDDGGVHKSSNLGTNWLNMNSNLCFGQIYRLSSNFYNADKLVAGLQDQGLGYLDKETGPGYWTTTPSMNANCGDGSQVISSPFHANYFIAGTVYNYNLYYSRDGIHFFSSDFYRPNNAIGSSIASLANHPAQPGVVFTVRFNKTSNGEEVFYTPFYILKSTDYGIYWRESQNNQYLRRFNNPYPWGCNTLIAISPSNPNVMIIDAASSSRMNYNAQHGYSRLLKTTDGGFHWLNEPNGSISSICRGGENGLPDRFFTHVEFSPTNSDTIYLTSSGFDCGHIFRSINGGYNWTDLSDDLPDSPVNDMIIVYSGVNEKQLWIASDVGVFYKNESSNTWIPAAPLSLPNCPIIDLDYNRISGKIRASAFGMGIWEITLEGPIYVRDKLYITDNINIDKDIIICPGGELQIGHPDLIFNPQTNFTLNFKNSHKIIVMNGGKLYAPGVNKYTLSSDNKWGGIKIEDGAKIDLDNVNFSNTNSPITLNTKDKLSGNCNISFKNCAFFNTTTELIHGNNIYFYKCAFNNSPGTTIIILYCDNIVFEKSTITNAKTGITILNSNVTLKNNLISYGIKGEIGINMHNCYSSVFKGNTIKNFVTGINMLDCAPYFLKNNFINTFESAINAQSSNSLLRPGYDGNGSIIWTAGQNVFNDSYIALSLYKGMNDISYGFNGINSTKYYIKCSKHNLPNYPAEYNCWDHGFPDFNKFFSDIFISWDPINCNPSEGASEKEEQNRESQSYSIIKEPVPPGNPLQDIIIDMGNVYKDTVNVTNGKLNMTPEKVLLTNCEFQELTGNFGAAINQYKSVIENYRDNPVSINAMNHILICYDKQQSDTAEYSDLRRYYQILLQNSSPGTAFNRNAAELANKTFVRQKKYSEAIKAYENVIKLSADTSDILNSEINIIEIYMLINSLEGDTLNFTGELSYLKPANNEEAIKMINERMHRSMNPQVDIKPVPVFYSLSQNYPNPFNPLTTINYTVPYSGKVIINIYDLLGRLVKVLVNENKEPGFYSVSFEGKNNASGVYLYRMAAGNFVSVKKMVLIK
ncbi:MAG: T9SS C-terminal target domain-containing protein [Ignavibacteriae bacterium]|nr:MAG: T9SS C-terminal target domain-containing protein [Ignavibacteriota bacterium]